MTTCCNCYKTEFEKIEGGILESQDSHVLIPCGTIKLCRVYVIPRIPLDVRISVE